jgi:hypothetical protein
MAKAPPTGGEWRAWYARFGTLIDRYHARQDDAGRLVRRVQRAMASLGVFLCEPGVEPTNNRAARSVRFAMMWRKGSRGTESDHGNRWVERTVSLRQTCRQRGQSTFGVWVDAVSRFCEGRQPDLAWLYEKARLTLSPCGRVPTNVVDQEQIESPACFLGSG